MPRGGVRRVGSGRPAAGAARARHNRVDAVGATPGVGRFQRVRRPPACWNWNNGQLARLRQRFNHTDSGADVSTGAEMLRRNYLTDPNQTLFQNTNRAAGPAANPAAGQAAGRNHRQDGRGRVNRSADQNTGPSAAGDNDATAVMWNTVAELLRAMNDRLYRVEVHNAATPSSNMQNLNVNATIAGVGPNPVLGGGFPPNTRNLASTGHVQPPGFNTTSQLNLPNAPTVGSTLSYLSGLSTAPRGYAGQGGVFHNTPPPLVLTSTTTPTGGNTTLAPVGAHAVTTSGNDTLAEWILAPEQEQAYLERHRAPIRGIAYFSGATGLAVQQFFGAIENLKNADPHFPGKLFVMIARERMNGSALEYVNRNAVLARTTDYALFKKTVCDRYGSGLEVTAKHELDTAKREAGESLACFAERLERLGSVVWSVPYNVGTAERSKLETERDGKLKEIFRLGLTTEAMTYLGARNPGSLNEMLALAIRFEANGEE